MFQYAAARALALKKHALLRLDIKWFKKSSNRKFELDCFNIPDDILATVGKTHWSDFFDFLKKPARDEYFQSEKYFKDIEKTIRKEFSLRRPFRAEAENWAKKNSSTQSVSVHIRRSDYLWEKHKNIHGILPIQYYLDAAKIIAEKIPNAVFYVFSDDIPWAKENLKLPYPIEFVSSEKISGPEEMILMSVCKNNIIANSSFSWWGAWLNNQPNKIVITPKNWFIDKTKTPNDVIPNNWTRI